VQVKASRRLSRPLSRRLSRRPLVDEELHLVSRSERQKERQRTSKIEHRQARASPNKSTSTASTSTASTYLSGDGSDGGDGADGLTHLRESTRHERTGAPPVRQARASPNKSTSTASTSTASTYLSGDGGDGEDGCGRADPPERSTRHGRTGAPPFHGSARAVIVIASAFDCFNLMRRFETKIKLSRGALTRCQIRELFDFLIKCRGFNVLLGCKGILGWCTQRFFA
jgi:hypothetical protein